MKIWPPGRGRSARRDFGDKDHGGGDGGDGGDGSSDGSGDCDGDEELCCVGGGVDGDVGGSVDGDVGGDISDASWHW